MRHVMYVLAALAAVPAQRVQAQALANGQPVTPTLLSGATCVGCTMADPVLIGTPIVNGGNIVTSPTPATASGVVYLHRYANVTLSVPAVAIGGTGTGTATVVGTAAGDQCFIAPIGGTSALGYIMGSGWVTTAGTVKVALAAPSVLAISATSISVNILCAQ